MKKVKVAINGFGRIGRQVAKIIMDDKSGLLDLVAINDLYDSKMNAHLFKYDSSYGKCSCEVVVDENDDLIVDGHWIDVLQERDPNNLPWKDLGVDLVIESTGVFTTARSDEKTGKTGADAHIKAGAKKVIITAPAKGEDITIVMGVNDKKYDPELHHIVSNASCTTNALAPAAKIVNDNWGIVNAVMSTVHSYTNDQVLLDQGHKKDVRRGRAAALNIVPTSTGAAKAIALVIPELAGKFDGHSLRIPTPTVSIIDFVALLEKDTTIEEVNQAFIDAAEGEYKGIVGVVKGEYDDPLVSVDFRGDTRSSIVDLPNNMLMGTNLLKVVTWYDNEWGYSSRTVDLAKLIASRMA